MLSHNWPGSFAFEWGETMHGRPLQGKYLQYMSDCCKERENIKRTWGKGKIERGEGRRKNIRRRKDFKENLGKKIDNQEKVKSTRSNKNKIRRNSKVVKTERE